MLIICCTCTLLVDGVVFCQQCLQLTYACVTVSYYSGVVGPAVRLVQECSPLFSPGLI